MPALDEPLFRRDQRPDFDDIAGDTVFEDLNSLRGRDTSRKQLNEISRFEDCRGIVGLARSLNSHGAFDQVKCTGNTVLFQLFGDQGPYFFQILLAISRMALLG